MRAGPRTFAMMLLPAGLLPAAGVGAGAATTQPHSPEAGGNLLCNAGFEAGRARPDGWRPFVPRRADCSFSVDTRVSRGGRRSARIDARDGGAGMWQQVVPVRPRAFYRLTGYVRLENVGTSKRGAEPRRPGRLARLAPSPGCCFQLVFRSAEGRILQFVHLPMHRGTTAAPRGSGRTWTDWLYDLPHPITVRAPAESAKVEVNLFLRGPGTAWFDDVRFAAAPTGTICGRVTAAGKEQSAIEGVEVLLWGTDFRARTDAAGRYELAGVPVASPRYILLAGKAGYDTRPAGDIAVRGGERTRVDLQLAPGDDRRNVDLRVKFCSLRRCRPAQPASVPAEAAIDADAYPADVRCYLKPSECVDSDHALVRRTAAEILARVPAAQRRNTRAVAWAVYQWIIRNVEFDTTYDPADGRGTSPTNYTDVTSGKWQTVSRRGWCWGHNFTDWLYKPSEALRQRRGICIEHSRLATALLRAVGIPARPAKPYQAQFWVQAPAKGASPRSADAAAAAAGGWCAMSTNGGRAAWRDRGDASAAFGRRCRAGAPGGVHFFSADAGPIVHSDWHTQRKCLWREVHPWSASYPASADGLRRALADMAAFAKTGRDPQRGEHLRRGRRPARRPERPTTRGRRPTPGDERYVLGYCDFTLNLSNIGSQRTLRVRFPFPSASEHVSYDARHRAYWTSHRRWVRRTWVADEVGPGGRRQRWFHIEFDLSPLARG